MPRWDLNVLEHQFHGQGIYPDGEGKVNEAGIAFYKSMFEECRKYGIEPLVTLCHFDVPMALVNKYGSFRSRHRLIALHNMHVHVLKRLMV